MGNGQSGCYPRKVKEKEEEEVVFADPAEHEQPPAAAEENQPEQEEAPQEAEEEAPEGAASPAPPLVHVQLKSVNDKRSKCEWYEFGIDEKVCAILRACEMEHYIPNFAFHHVEFETLPRLTVEDLKDMNVNRVGHRRKLLGKFNQIKSK
jgi:hypothetical protein